MVSEEVKNDVKASDMSQHECMSYLERTLLGGVKWPTGVLENNETITSVMSPVTTSTI